MQVSPRINFVTSLYCHVENIAAYHKWTNKNYAKYFESVEHARAAHDNLEWYKTFRKKSFWNRQFENAFTAGSIEDVFRDMDLDEDEMRKLKELFIYFMEDYRKIWLENTGQLAHLEKKIIEMWESERESFIEKASFITKNMPGKVDVFLCWNPIEFKATPFGTSSIIIETNSHIPDEKVLDVVPHEIGHLLDMSYGPDSFSVFEKRWGLEKGMLVHEAVISLFFPGPVFENEGKWNKDVRLLASKLRPVLEKSIVSGEDYRGFLSRIHQVLDQEQFGSTDSSCPTTDPT
jgi:hypothetical protein